IALAQSPHVVNLTALNIASNRVTTAGIGELARSPYLEQLTTLDLAQTYPGSDLGEVLSTAPLLRRLTNLDLSGCHAFNGPAVRALVSAGSPVQLENLSLSGCQVGDEGARHWAGVIGPPLRELSLNHARIGDAGARALAEAEGLETLHALSLRGNTISA